MKERELYKTLAGYMAKKDFTYSHFEFQRIDILCYNPDNRLIAVIEVKRKGGVKRALAQAMKSQKKAHFLYVASVVERVQVNVLMELRSYGVGLLQINPKTNEVLEVLPARLTTPTDLVLAQYLKNAVKVPPDIKTELNPKAFKELAGIKSLQAGVLYGSFARGDTSPKSDIDLLLIFDSKAEARRQEEHAAEILIHARVKKLIVSTCMGIEELKESPDLFFNVMRDGKVLYKRIGVEAWPPANALGGRPMTIYEFDLAGLSQQKKVKLDRTLYGTQVQKYSYKGLVEQRGGHKLGRGVVMVPADAEAEFDGIFDVNKIRTKKKYVHFISEA